MAKGTENSVEVEQAVSEVQQENESCVIPAEAGKVNSELPDSSKIHSHSKRVSFTTGDSRAEKAGLQENSYKDVEEELRMLRRLLKEKNNREDYENKKKERREICREIFKKNRFVDIAFIVDCTYSMEPWINEVESKIDRCIDKIEQYVSRVSVGEEPVVRMAFVGYGDFAVEQDDSEMGWSAGFVHAADADAVPGKYKHLQLDFTTDRDAFHDHLANLKCMDGGDYAEDVISGLELATKLSWEQGYATTRLVIHFAEAPGHGAEMQPDEGAWDGVELEDSIPELDFFPDGDPKDRDIQYFLSRLKCTNRVCKYWMFHVPSHHWTKSETGDHVILTHRMADAFKKAIDDAEFIDEQDLSDIGDIAWAIVGSVTQSVSHVSRKTATAAFEGPASASSEISCGSSCSRAGIVFQPGKPNWETVELEKATRNMECKKFKDIEELREILIKKLPSEDPNKAIRKVFKWNDRGYALIKRAPNPFSDSGASRLAYYGVRSVLDRNTQETVQKPVVLKQFKSMARGANREKNYLRLLASQTVASKLAEMFEAKIQKLWNEGTLDHLPGKIHVVKAHLVTFRNDDKVENFFLEPELQGDVEFMKFEGNTGAVRERINVLEAFKHFSYDASERMVVVTDLQGVKRYNERSRRMEYTITDPVVLTNDGGVFGDEDLGTEGIKDRFINHSCNEICRKMRLQRHANQVRQLVLDGENLAFEGSRQSVDDDDHGRFHAVRLKELVDMLLGNDIDVVVCLNEKYRKLYKNPGTATSLKLNEICGAILEDFRALEALDGYGVMNWIRTTTSDSNADERAIINYCFQTSAFLVTNDKPNDWVAQKLVNRDWMDSMVLRCVFWPRSAWFFDRVRNPTDEAVETLKKLNIYEGQLASA